MTEINDKAQLDIAAADDTDAVTSDTPEETVNTPEVDETFELSAAKMREHGMSETAINQFRHLYDVWRHEEASSWIREDDIEPLGHVPSFHDVYETINHDKAVDAFASHVQEQYGRATGLEAKVYPVMAAAGAGVLAPPS